MKYILVVCSLLCAVTAASDYVTTPAGGTGGTAFNISCPADKVMVGIRGGSGQFVDRIEPICVKVYGNGHWLGEPSYDGGTAGGPGGFLYERKCQRNYAVSTIRGRASGFVEQLEIGCHAMGVTSNAIKLQEASTVWLAAFGGPGGEAFGPYRCQGGDPGHGFQGNAGSWLDKISMVCSPPQNPARPATPVLTNPYDNAEFERTGEGASIYLDWENTAGVARYEVCMEAATNATISCTFSALNSRYFTKDPPALTADITTSRRYIWPANPHEQSGIYMKWMKWMVRACNVAGCSDSAARRVRLRYPDAKLQSPANGATAADRRPNFVWSTMSMTTAPFRLEVVSRVDGVKQTFDVPATTATTQNYTPTSDLSVKSPVSWMVHICDTAGVCGSGPGSSALNTLRDLTLPAVSFPPVSFATHLYPKIVNDCIGCHPTGGTYYPQNPAGRTDVTGTACNEGLTIPFDTTITAVEMLSRFKCLTAKSTRGEYASALGKVYVVPGSAAYSGLHHKAQASTVSTFADPLTIGGIQKSVREWIAIWIDQGAYD